MLNAHAPSPLRRSHRERVQRRWQHGTHPMQAAAFAGAKVREVECTDPWLRAQHTN